MSQHLITEFINRTYVFKPLNDSKIANHKVKKFQGSSRKNNFSPAMVAESTHMYHKIHVKKKKKEQQADTDSNKHIDITI
jgi:hypothetical protein